MRTFLLLTILAGSAAAADLADLAWIEGEWQGYSIMGNKSNLNHKWFVREMGGTYLVERTVAVFPPAEPTTEYETHQDQCWYYAMGDEVRMKGFFVEGFVSSGTVSISGDTLTVLSTAVEGGPPSMRTRLRYVRMGEDRMIGDFEIDWNGDGFRPSSTYEFRRLR